MTKLNIFVAVLVALQLFQVLGGGYGYGFDVSKSKTYLNAGSCFVYPGVSTSGYSGNYGVKYYNLPYGWKQFEDKVVIPNVLSSRGDWTFGGRAVFGGNAINDQFRVQVNGLQVKIISGSASKNLVIGSNYRSSEVDDRDWSGFVSSLSRGGNWLSDNDDAYWFPGVGRQAITSTGAVVSATGSGSGSGSGYSYGQTLGGSGTTVGISGLLDSLFSPRGSTTTTTVYVSTPSQTVTGGPSADDRKRALDQQYAATQALNDLNTLIGQLTASVDSTAATVSRLESEVNNYRSGNSQCNDKIMELSKAKLTAETAIASITGQVNSYKIKIADFTPALNNLVERRNQLIRSRSSLENSKSPNANLLSQLEGQYTSCTSQVDTYRSDYSRVQGSVNSNNDRINTIRSNAADAPNQIRLANQELSTLDSTISDLELRLSQAKAQRSKVQGDIVNYNNIITTSNSQISTIESDNSRLRSQLSTLQGSIDSQVVQCTTYQTRSNEIRTSIASSQQDYDEISRQIEVQENLIASKKSELERYQAESGSLPSRLTSLQNDLTNAQTALSRQYYICNQAADSINKARSDLDAANLKLTTERKFLSDAQAKVATLTAQKRAADDAVTRILSTPTTTTTTPGTGSVSITIGGGARPVTGGVSGVATTSYPSTSSTGSSSYIYGAAPVAVGSIGDYLGRVYGSSLKSYWQPYVSSSTYATMYPLSSVTVGALYGRSSAGIFLPSSGTYLSGITRSQIGSSSLPSNIISDFTCSGNDFVSGYGYITSVQPGYVTVSGASGDSVNLRIGGCSQLESTKPEYVMSVADRVFYRGKRSLSKDVHLYDLTCLSW